MTTSIALLDCPHCIDEFAFDYQKIAKLTYGWRVRVRCPGCGNIVEVVMLAYTLIHGCDPAKYQAGEITEILPPDPNPSPGWRMAVNKLRMEILQKKTGWRPLSHAHSSTVNQFRDRLDDRTVRPGEHQASGGRSGE